MRVNPVIIDTLGISCLEYFVRGVCMYTIVLVQMLKNSGDSSGYQNYKCTEKHSVTKQMIYVTCDLLKLSIKATLRKMLLNIIRKFSSGRHFTFNKKDCKSGNFYTYLVPICMPSNVDFWKNGRYLLDVRYTSDKRQMFVRFRFSWFYHINDKWNLNRRYRSENFHLWNQSCSQYILKQNA